MADHPTHSSLFVNSLVAALLPYFQAGLGAPEATVHAEILATMTSYGASTNAGMLHAALSIAFGMSALEALAEARQDPDLTPTQCQRIRGGANALSRACQQNARLAADRPECDASESRQVRPPEAQALPSRTLPPLDLSEDDVTQILRQADATINTCRNRLAPPAAGRAMPRSRESALAHLFAEAARTA